MSADLGPVDRYLYQRACEDADFQRNRAKQAEAERDALKVDIEVLTTNRDALLSAMQHAEQAYRHKHSPQYRADARGTLSGLLSLYRNCTACGSWWGVGQDQRHKSGCYDAARKP